MSNAPSVAGQLAGLLAEAGLRVTTQRVTLLGLLVRQGGHLTADELHRRACGELPGLSATSIYKSLRALRDAGLVREVALDAGAVRYDANVGRPHHHSVCRGCGRIEDVACRSDAATACVAEHDLGDLSADHVEVVFRGRCAACRAASSAVRSDTIDEGGQP